MRTDPKRGDPMDDLDLVADLNAQDDDGLAWSTLSMPTRPGGCGRRDVASW